MTHRVARFWVLHKILPALAIMALAMPLQAELSITRGSHTLAGPSQRHHA